MSSNRARRRHAGRSLLQEHLQAHFLADLRANDTEFSDNPTRVDKPFWKYMVSHGDKEAYGARKWFGVNPDPERWGQEPIFCFSRFGRTETKLPGGRIIYIGGEHEDFYDPDFYIYNDVVVSAETDADDADARSASGSEDGLSDHEIERQEYWKKEKIKEDLKTAASAAEAKATDIEIYGYPTDVFPATDFHTATYVKDVGSSGETKEYIYIIGGPGPTDGPHSRATLTHRFDLQDYSIQRMETSGEIPPPRRSTSEERAAELQEDRILYTVGKEEWVLYLADMRWPKLSR